METSNGSDSRQARDCQTGAGVFRLASRRVRLVAMFFLTRVTADVEEVPPPVAEQVLMFQERSLAAERFHAIVSQHDQSRQHSRGDDTSIVDPGSVL